MCSLRDAAKELASLNATVYGISRDDVKSMAAFAEEQKLGFALLSDPDGSAVEKYGTPYEGRPFAKRITFYIDPKGILRHVDPEENVRGHGEEVVATLKRLQAADK